MKKILIVDTNYGFLSDVESRLILDEIENVEISTRNKIDGIHDEIESLKPDELIIFANLLNSHPSWDFGVAVKTYARDASGIALSNEKGFPCYGVVKNAGDLITAIEQNKIVQVGQSTPAPTQATNQPLNNTPAPNPVQNPVSPAPAPVQMPNMADTQTQSRFGNSYDNNMNNSAMNGYNNAYPSQNAYQNNYQAAPQQAYPGNNGNTFDYLKENKEAVLAALLSGQSSAPAPQTNPNNGWNQPQGGYNYPQGQYPQQPQYQPNGYNNPSNPMHDQMNGYGQQGYGQQGGGYWQYPNGMNQPEYEVARDMGAIKQKAKVISTYSAKGGVGKTTLSCELATLLALTSHGRGKYRVCIVDFNIDFGNVLNTLDFDPKKVSMSHWAANIRERIARGERPEDIQYNQSQIEGFLQHKDKDGLYALLAPLTNLDSMGIKSEEIEVMLRNIIHNGGFDFVVCDTGNNTRDASYLALNYSDVVFLILTQSVNAANSNQSFLMSVLPANFDMSKIVTVINMIKPEKEVGASVKEVKESVFNPATRRPFECIAEIKNLSAVQNAENTGEPLVYNSAHEFTQNIATMAKHVIGDNFVLPEMSKQNLFTDLLNKLGNLKK